MNPKTFACALALLLTATMARPAAPNDLTAALQKGLFEEEANRNLDAAIAAYQSLVTQFDKDRQIAATAAFRLGECYRKLGKTNEAASQYQRIVSEFADQSTLATLSRQNLVGMGIKQGSSSLDRGESGSGTQQQMRAQISELHALIAKIHELSQAQAAEALPTLLPVPDPGLEALLKSRADLERKLVSLQFDLGKDHPQLRSTEAELKAVATKLDERVAGITQGYEARLSAYQQALASFEDAIGSPRGVGTALSPAARAQQRRLMEEEIKLVEQKLTEQQKMVQVGMMPPGELITVQRELLGLKRQLVALSDEAQTTGGGEKTAPTDDEDQEVRRIQAMIQNSPDLINAGNDGTPLFHAAGRGQLVVARYLLDHGADVNAKPNGQTPLWQATLNGHKAMLELLLAHGADANARGSSDKTPLHLAAEHGFNAATEVLLTNRADANAKDKDGHSPLHAAAQSGNLEIARLLVEKGADANAKDNNGDTPLHNAARSGHSATAKVLLDAKADVNALNKKSRAPLHLAAEAGHLEVVSLLLDRGAKVDPRGERDETPLLLATSGRHADVVRALLEHKADPDAVGFGVYPLSVAIGTGSTELLEVLLTHGADPNFHPVVGNSTLNSPLFDAINGKHPDAVALLLKFKADPNLRLSPAPDGNVPLHWAIGQPQIVKLLLDDGGLPNVAGHDDQTPLLDAAERGDRESAELLLQHGADPNLFSRGQYTALHQAVAHRNQPMVELLLQNKADPNARDKDGRTPLDYAKEMTGTGPPPRALGLPSPAGMPPGMQNFQGFPGLPGGALPGNTVPSVSPSIGGGGGSEAKPPPPSISDLLRQHGALDDLPKLDRIEVSRSSSGYRSVAFYLSSKNLSRFSLLELIASVYGFVSTRTAGDWETQNTSATQLWNGNRCRFPDLKGIVIHRPAQDGRARTAIPVDVSEVLRKEGGTNDVMLQPGDVVEIPEADHPVAAQWLGLGNDEITALIKCLARTVSIHIGASSTTISLAPDWNMSPTSPRPVGIGEARWDLTRPSFMVRSVLDHSKLVRFSSDLAHVKVTRRSPMPGEAGEWVLDCSDPNKAPDFWLRDGDVVEVPEKP